MLEALLVVGTTACAVQAMRATRLLFSAICLAGASVFLSLTVYALGAHEVAVIELSVGAGLVAVLFVFAIAVAGDDALAAHSLTPRWLAGALLAAALVLLGWLGLTVVPAPAPSVEPPFGQALWQQRSLDVLLQVVIIFAGVMGVLILLGGSALSVRALPAAGEPREAAAETLKEAKPASTGISARHELEPIAPIGPGGATTESTPEPVALTGASR